MRLYPLLAKRMAPLRKHRWVRSQKGLTIHLQHQHQHQHQRRRRDPRPDSSAPRHLNQATVHPKERIWEPRLMTNQQLWGNWMAHCPPKATACIRRARKAKGQDSRIPSLTMKIILRQRMSKAICCRI